MWIHSSILQAILLIMVGFALALCRDAFINLIALILGVIITVVDFIWSKCKLLIVILMLIGLILWIWYLIKL